MSGEIKPSSERGVHALVYRQRPEANFVIHTHQTQASAVSVVNKTEIPSNCSFRGRTCSTRGIWASEYKKARKGR